MIITKVSLSLFASVLVLALFTPASSQAPAGSKPVTLADLVSNTGELARKASDRVYVFSLESESKRSVSVLVGHENDYLIFVVELAKGTEYKMSPGLAEALLRFQSKIDWVRVELSDKGDLQLFIHDNWSHANQKDFNERLFQMVGATDIVTKILEPHLNTKKSPN